jgi:hypothetical protein
MGAGLLQIVTISYGRAFFRSAHGRKRLIAKATRRLPITYRAAPGETRVPWGRYHGAAQPQA